MIKRNQALVVIFTIITCGIYGLYWMYATARDIEEQTVTKGGPCSSPALVVLFSLITCGFYEYYFWFQEGRRTDEIKRRYALSGSDSGIAYLLLAIFGLSIVGMVLLQSELNAVVDRMSVMPPSPLEPTAPSGNEKDDFRY